MGKKFFFNFPLEKSKELEKNPPINFYYYLVIIQKPFQALQKKLREMKF